MNAGDVHAIMMIGVVALTLANFVSGGRMTPEKEGTRSFAALILLIMIVAFIHHLLTKEGPVAQGLICGVCGLLVLYYTRPSRSARNSVLVILIATIGLCIHYQYLVDTDEFAGNSENRKSHAFKAASEGTIRSIVDSTGKHQERLPRGWVTDWLFVSGISDEQRKLITSVKQSKLTYPWHCWFTRLYETETHKCAPWWRGGTFAEGRKHIEFRPTSD